jgi:hypothetical protein
MITEARHDLVQRAAREWWPNLPLLLLGSIPVAAGWAALRAVAGGSSWIALLGTGVLVLPLFAALLHSCTRLLAHEHVGVLQLVRRWPHLVVRAWRVTGPLTLVAVLTATAAAAWQQGGQPWMLLSLGICAAVLAGVVVVGVVALPYALRGDTGWTETWLVSAYVASRHPVPVLGVLSACGVAVWASAHLSFALLILVPGPLALIWAAAVSEAILRGRERLAEGHRQLA